MNLTDNIVSVVVGSLLGDGYLYKNGTLQIEQAIAQKEYVFWKYEMLKDIAGEEPKTVERYDKRTDKIYKSVRFYTKAALKQFREVFYKEGKKVVPENISELLDPLALSVWFMDDGGRGARTPKGLVFNTSCFTENEQIRLKSVFANQFGVSISIHRVGKGFQLYIKAESFEKFSKLVSPYLITPMRYKIPIDPVTTLSL